MEIQAMRHFLSLVASYRNSGRIGDQAKALVLMKVMSEGDDRIIVQLYTKQMIHISQEKVPSRISEVIDWIVIKSQSHGLCKSNIHIVIMMGIQFRHSNILAMKKSQNSPTRQMRV